MTESQKSTSSSTDAVHAGTPHRRPHNTLTLGIAQNTSAAVSVSNNVAEGFERGTTQELLTLPVLRPRLSR